MSWRKSVAGLAVVAWAALALQLYLVLQVRWSMGASLIGGTIHFFSFFTVLSNTLAASVLTAWAWPRNTLLARWLRLPSVAGCTLVSILLVGLGYNLLLRQYWQPQGGQWLANAVLHNVMPLAFLAFWCACIPKGQLRCVHVGKWMLYPLGWYGFTLLRGWCIGVWPYPFIDAGELGFARAFANALGLLAAFCVGGLVVVGFDTRLSLRSRRPRPAANIPRP